MKYHSPSMAPTDLRDFLRSEGWSMRKEGLPRRVYVMEHPGHPRRQLIFPMDSAMADYLESVDSVVRKLAEMTGRSQSSLVSRVQSVREDVISLRISHGGDENALPLSFAATAVLQIERLLKAAACTVLRPRVHHPRLGLSEATQFAERSRFGQTSLGSFVINVACPLNALDVEGGLDMGEENSAPFARRVTLTLRRALTQLNDAIEEDALDRLIDAQRQSSAPLVSSNLCEALAGLHDETINNALDVSFDWSCLRCVPAADLARSPIRFQREYFARVEEVRRELRQIERDTEDSFIGTVERLDGEMGADSRRHGAVVLSLLLPDEGETVRARLLLNADQYAQADHAHMTNGAYIRVAGRLRQGRQPRQLTDVSRFEVLSPAASNVRPD